METNPKIVLIANKIEPPGYAESCKITENAFLLIVFQSETLFSYDGNNYFEIPANTAIFYRPYSEKHYKSYKGSFLNSFMFFYVPESYFAKYSIVFNTALVLNKEEADDIVFEMDRLSYVINTPYAKNHIGKIPQHIDNILKKMSLVSTNLDKHIFGPSLRTSFINIRGMMYADPTKVTVKVMAEAIGFSETYFGIKYRDFFNITPSQDRKIRIVELIKKYLAETDYSLEIIADLCNIKNVAHLINIFKSVENTTPHQYRKKLMLSK